MDTKETFILKTQEKIKLTLMLDFGFSSTCRGSGTVALCSTVWLGPVWGKANILCFISWVSCEVGLLLQAYTIKTCATEMWRELGNDS